MPGTTPAETSSSGLVGGFEMVTASASDDGTLADDGQAPLTQQQLAQAPAHIGHLAPQLQPTTAPTGANDTVLPTAVAPSQH